MNSWSKSDSSYCYIKQNCAGCANVECLNRDDMYGGNAYSIGKNDFDLMKKLVKSGTDHSKFMRMINVTLDITAPMYWWKEADTYKVGTVRNSCSTMHKIAEKEFTLDDFSHEHLSTYNLSALGDIICALNRARLKYINGEPDTKKFLWWQMIQLLPSSYNQRATVQMNYQVLWNMYHARKNHKLDEWLKFCEWIKTLPYSELITMGKEKNNA